MTHSRNVRKYCRVLAILMIGVALLSTSHAMADGTNKVTAVSSYVPNNTMVTFEPTAFTFPINDQTPHCQRVTNTCSQDIMVPVNSEAEWQSFLNNHEACAVIQACPAIKVTMTASPTNVLSGSNTTIGWTITGGTGPLTATLTSTDNAAWSQTYNYTAGVSETGSAVLTPTPLTGNTSTTYTLTVTDTYGDSNVGTVTVTVGQPLTVSLISSSANIANGSSTTLSYAVTDNSNLTFSCTASSTDGSWSTSYNGNAAISGTVSVTPTANSSVTYTLACTDSLQTNVQQSVVVSAVPPINGVCGPIDKADVAWQVSCSSGSLNLLGDPGCVSIGMYIQCVQAFECVGSYGGTTASCQDKYTTQ